MPGWCGRQGGGGGCDGRAGWHRAARHAGSATRRAVPAAQIDGSRSMDEVYDDIRVVLVELLMKLEGPRAASA